MRPDDETRNAARTQLSKLQTQHRAAHDALDKAGAPHAAPPHPTHHRGPLTIAERVVALNETLRECKRLVGAAVVALEADLGEGERRALASAIQRKYAQLAKAGA